MHDCKAQITFIKSEDGGRSRPCISGYRPNHLIIENYLTTGTHTYIGTDKVDPGQNVIGYIDFITPDEYPNSLWKDKKIRIQEGGRVVGSARILAVYNDQLNGSQPPGNVAKSLLDIYSRRLAMINKGVIDPGASIAQQVANLVDGLEKCDDDDYIRLNIAKGRCTFVNDFTYEQLAEIPTDAEQGGQPDAFGAGYL